MIKILNLFPVRIQNMIISIYGLYWKWRRKSKVFKIETENFRNRNDFTNQEWIQYQTKELRLLLLHCWDNVPFYRNLFESKGFKKHDFQTFDISDLKQIPFLEKETLRNFGSDTLLSNIRNKGIFISSSGSTGKPVEIFYSHSFHQKWMAAYEVRVLNFAGVSSKMSRAMIGGRHLIRNNKPPFYRYNSAEKQVYLSAYHISAKNASNYIHGIKKYKSEFLVGYASSIYALSKHIIDQNLMLDFTLKAVLTSSEKLSIEMRSVIEKAFGCIVYDSYSGVEACGLIAENSQGKLWLSPDTGILELGKKNTNGEQEVYFTGLLNKDQPLIRYRIGDYVKVSEQFSKNFIIEEISGREEDVVKTAAGINLKRFHSIYIGLPGLIESQLIQKSCDNYQINLVVDKNWSFETEKVMKNRIINLIGTIHLEFKYLESIPRGANGKFKAVISLVE